MVPKSKSTRNADYRHAQSIARQRQAAQRAAADVSIKDLADILPHDESPMLPDTEPVTASAAAPDPALQRAVVSACEHVQRMYDSAVDAARLTRAADIVFAGGVQHESPHHAMLTSKEITRRVKAKREHHSDPPDAATVPTPVDETPVCPYHGSMRPSSKVPGTFYCASKMGDGSYCRERWPKTK